MSLSQIKEIKKRGPQERLLSPPPPSGSAFSGFQIWSDVFINKVSAIRLIALSVITLQLGASCGVATLAYMFCPASAQNWSICVFAE